jgi:WD40 repeat protein
MKFTKYLPVAAILWGLAIFAPLVAQSTPTPYHLVVTLAAIQPEVKQGFWLGNNLAWSPDSQVLAIASGRIWLFEVKTNTLTELPLTRGVTSEPIFFPTGDRIVYLTRDQIVIYDLRTDSSLQTAHDGALQIALNVAGTRLAIGSGRGISVWDTEDLTQVARFKTEISDNEVGDLVFSPDGRFLLSSHSYSGIMVWDLANLPNTAEYTPSIPTLEITDGIRAWMAFLPDQPTMLAFTNTVNFDDTTYQYGQLLRQGAFARFMLESVSPITLGEGRAYDLSEDGTLFLVGTNDGSIDFRHVESGELLYRLPAHSKPVIDLELSPDQHWLVSVGLTETLQLWQVTP